MLVPSIVVLTSTECLESVDQGSILSSLGTEVKKWNAVARFHGNGSSFSALVPRREPARADQASELLGGGAEGQILIG